MNTNNSFLASLPVSIVRCGVESQSGIYAVELCGADRRLSCPSPPPGVPPAVRREQLLRPRGHAVLRDALPRAARLALRQLREADHRPLHHGDAQEVPPGALRVRVLPQAAQQGHVQGAEREALLPSVLREAVRLSRVLSRALSRALSRRGQSSWVIDRRSGAGWRSEFVDVVARQVDEHRRWTKSQVRLFERIGVIRQWRVMYVPHRL